MIISLKEAQAKLPELIDNLKLGEELLITGLCQGMITIVADDEEHWQDFLKT